MTARLCALSVLLIALVAPLTAAVPAADVRTFGTAISAAQLTHDELELFSYEVKGQVGAAITHWWFTGGPKVDDVLFRFFIDGESKPSIAIPLNLAAGIGFDDDAAPWGTEMIGKGAASGGVFNNIRIPFFKSIRITCQLPASAPIGTYWWIVRGAEGVLPISVGNVELPRTAKLRVHSITNMTYNPLEIVNIVTADAGGAFFMWTLSVASGNLNFLEGCVRCYIDGGPKILLSSGTEDYFDSAFYFNAGPYRLPVSGMTHIKTNPGVYGTELSAYRFHTTDPIVWQSSFVFNWRNGDTLASNGQKCIDDNGSPAGNPQKSAVTSYAWVYHY